MKLGRWVSRSMLLRDRLRAWLGPLGQIAALVRWLEPAVGFSAHALRPIDHIAAVRAPIFMLAGKEDRYTLIEESRAPSGDSLVYPNDLWAWNGTSWHRLEPKGTERPPCRNVPHMVYDAARRRVVMFGGRGEGHDGGQILADMWEWDGVQWHAVENRGFPKTLHSAIAYDPVRRRVVMYGGLNDHGLSRSTLEWDGQRWSVRDTAGPIGVITGAAVVNASGQLAIMTSPPSGDRDPIPDSSTTWMWNGSSWKRAERGSAFANLQPTANAADGTLYWLQVAERWLTSPVLHVRRPNGTWLTVSSPAPGRYGSMIAYDARRRKLVMYGGGRQGQRFSTETWELDGTSWTRR